MIGGLELEDRLFHLLGTVEGEPVEGMPLRDLPGVMPDRWPELGEELERLIRRIGIQGQGNLLQPEVEQAKGLLLGIGQTAGAGIVALCL